MKIAKRYTKFLGYTENGYVGFHDESSSSTDVYQLIEDLHGNVHNMRLIKTFPSLLKVLAGKADKLLCDNVVYQKGKDEEWILLSTLAVKEDFISACFTFD